MASPEDIEKFVIEETEHHPDCDADKLHDGLCSRTVEGATQVFMPVESPSSEPELPTSCGEWDLETNCPSVDLIPDEQDTCPETKPQSVSHPAMPVSSEIELANERITSLEDMNKELQRINAALHVKLRNAAQATPTIPSLLNDLGESEDT